MPHIYWRRLYDNIEEILTHSEVRTCTEMHRTFESLKKLLRVDTTFWQLWRSCQKSETDQLLGECCRQQQQFGRTQPNFWFCFEL